MTWMAERALAQALDPLRALHECRIAALIALPPDRPGFSAANARSLARALMERIDLPLNRKLCGAYDTGHEGGAAALARAAELIESRQTDFCLVGGVECYFDPQMLEWLADANRLKSEERSSGMIPGEGAAFALLARNDVARRHQIPACGSVVSVGRAIEPSPWYLGRPTQGRGLTIAIGNAFSAAPETQKADVTYSDATGEHWRADEWSFAYLRTAAHHGEPLELCHPADCWGDVGAASASLLIALALVNRRRGRARGPVALVCLTSDTRPGRGAVLIEAE
jgi:3-oxoacyl-[acyl-carrier-protein] synthase-1